MQFSLACYIESEVIWPLIPVSQVRIQDYLKHAFTEVCPLFWLVYKEMTRCKILLHSCNYQTLFSWILLRNLERIELLQYHTIHICPALDWRIIYFQNIVMMWESTKFKTGSPSWMIDQFPSAQVAKPQNTMDVYACDLFPKPTSREMGKKRYIEKTTRNLGGKKNKTIPGYLEFRFRPWVEKHTACELLPTYILNG